MKGQHKTLADGTGAGKGWILEHNLGKARYVLDQREQWKKANLTQQGGQQTWQQQQPQMQQQWQQQPQQQQWQPMQQVNNAWQMMLPPQQQIQYQQQPGPYQQQHQWGPPQGM